MSEQAFALEKATNYLLREVYEKFAVTLAEVDSAMALDDSEMVDILGPGYGAVKTPPPASFQLGHVPEFHLLDYSQYPVVGVWGHVLAPTRGLEEEVDAWGLVRGRFVLQAALLSSDTILLTRWCYRYAATMQALCRDTTLGHLADPVFTTGTLDISMDQFREMDDQNRRWYAQSVIYQFEADFVIS